MKMPPEGLRLSGDFSATLTATMPTTHPPLVFPPPCPAGKAQAPARYQIPAHIGVACHRQPPPDPLGLHRHGHATPPRTAQNPGRGAACHAGKRPVRGLYRPCNSAIMRRQFRDGTRKPTQADNIGRLQVIPLKNKPLKTPSEPPHGIGKRNPATMGGDLMKHEAAAPGRKKPPPDNQGRECRQYAYVYGVVHCLSLYPLTATGTAPNLGA